MAIQLTDVGDDQLDAAVASAAVTLGWREDVLSVYRVKDGYITDEPAVVVVVPRKLALTELQGRGIVPLPRQVEGFPIDVASAAVLDFLPNLEAFPRPVSRHPLDSASPTPAPSGTARPSAVSSQ